VFNAALKKSVKPSMSNDAEKLTDPESRRESLSIEVTTRCNCECTHCFARGRNSEDVNLSARQVKKIVLEGFDAAYRHLHITGGEPLLWQNLIELLDYVFGMGYQTVFLNSNGTLLTKEISKRLAAYDGLSISVSLEGSRAFHEHLRGSNSYGRTVNGIETALAAGLNLYIFTTAYKGLLPNLPHYVDALYERFPGIRHLVLIQLFSTMNPDFAYVTELLDPRDFIQLVRMVALLNLHGLRTCLLNSPLARVAAKLMKMPWIPKSPPLYRERSLIITANQDLRLSHSSRESFAKYEFGKIQKVLASEAYRKAVAPDQSTCPACKYHMVCNENDMVRPSDENWDTDANERYCESVLDNVMPWAQPDMQGSRILSLQH
jgi:MoaA/NifB/PqqE/SkfB family radical SAM enzyme